MPSFHNIQTSVDTSDGAVKSSKGWVHWVAACAGATGGAWQLNDSTDDSGTDLFSHVQPANSSTFFSFVGAPLQFGSGIYADIPGTNVTLTVGYV
jgi:hypothetical protein